MNYDLDDIRRWRENFHSTECTEHYADGHGLHCDDADCHAPPNLCMFDCVWNLLDCLLDDLEEHLTTMPTQPTHQGDEIMAFEEPIKWEVAVSKADSYLLSLANRLQKEKTDLLAEVERLQAENAELKQRLLVALNGIIPY